MEFRHSKIRDLFHNLSKKVDQYLHKKSETCFEESGDDPNEFYECIKTSTSDFKENYYKFENLSLYADLREKQCANADSDYNQCIDGTIKDLNAAIKDLEPNFE